MKNYIWGMITILIISVACAMGGKSKRLTSAIDQGKTPWEFCTPAMIESGNAFFSDGAKVLNHKGNLCLIECALKLKKDGTCKKDKYKYPVKNLKVDHDFFMNKYIATPESEFY